MECCGVSEEVVSDACNSYDGDAPSKVVMRDTWKHTCFCMAFDRLLLGGFCEGCVNYGQLNTC